MKTTPFVLCFGELLIDMIATKPGSLMSAPGFLKKFGGAPANTAMGLAKLGVPVGFMGKVGVDAFGAFLKQTLDENHVDTSRLVISPTNNTTLAFVSLTKDGGRDFSFYKDAHEDIHENDVALPKNTFLLHFGSLLQTTSQNRAATEKLIKQAKKTDTILSYDPNLRKPLWNNLDEARSIILATAKKVDILKINDDEACFLTHTKDVKKAVAIIFTPNLEVLIITQGGNGCYYKTKKNEGHVPTIKVVPVDTTGAGDAFNAGFINQIVKKNKRIRDFTEKELEEALQKANIIASLTTLKKGAIDAFPTHAEIEKAMLQ